eukprot:CAMPEP_0177212922 /NCGR_PEP_ID=MMETSP0367-20130122/32889_1 /TAXON_ID=447022 ORGANISM="Scrippsiella hangoei-like, Strain SHHI-4" /NCGR_SAMPLE_ID=MMETSP0367 /ASSEMBLY_ACC=CAM_ASM_000362 /LENGTH=44 /DNA_ID= /DNA_START= /DNA_END= /DNA_ORIENTATION=
MTKSHARQSQVVLFGKEPCEVDTCDVGRRESIQDSLRPEVRATC